MAEKILLDTTKIKIVPIEDVFANSWNPKEDNTEEYQTIKRGIEENGLDGFIWVRWKEKKGKEQTYEVVDGMQRYTACKELGYTRIPIYDFEDISLRKAQQKTLWFQAQVPFDEIKLSELLADIIKSGENVNVPYTEEQMQNYLKLADFDWDAYNSEKPNDDEGGAGKTIKVTDDQYAVIADAIDKVKTDSDEKRISDGRALELICADFLGGPTSSLAGVTEEAFATDANQEPFPTQEESSEEYQH